MEAGISLETSVNIYHTTLHHIAKYREDGGVDEWGVEDWNGSGRNLIETKLGNFQEGLGKLTKNVKISSACIDIRTVHFWNTNPICCYTYLLVWRSEVTMMITVMWVMMPYRLVELYRRFRGTCWLVVSIDGRQYCDLLPSLPCSNFVFVTYRWNALRSKWLKELVEILFSV